jgi:hypothetical protein
VLARLSADHRSPTPEQFVADSPLEGKGFEPLVPREKGLVFRDHVDRPPAPSPPRKQLSSPEGVRISFPPAASPGAVLAYTHRSGGCAITEAENVGDDICRLFRRKDQVWHLRVRRSEENPQGGRSHAAGVGNVTVRRTDCCDPQREPEPPQSHCWYGPRFGEKIGAAHARGWLENWPRPASESATMGVPCSRSSVYPSLLCRSQP